MTNMAACPIKVNLNGVVTLLASESEMQALIKLCNLLQTWFKLNENKKITDICIVEHLYSCVKTKPYI